MAALRPEEIRDYAAEDADVTLRLEEVLRPRAPRALETEEQLVKILIDMEREGVKVDVAALKAYGRALDGDILALTQDILACSGPGFNPDSPKQLGELLFG